MRVVVEEYNPEWALQFQQIKRELQDVLREVKYIGIEHVGSTSVPGLAAKPVIDVSIISSGADVNAAIHALTSKGGYVYRGEMGIPDRHAFEKPGASPARHLYVSVEGCQSIRNQLGVRDICRKNPAVRDAYGRKKLELSQRDWRDGDQYCEAKNDILAWVLGKAEMSSDEREQVRQLNTTATS
ncbi:uncharacterized protein Z520_00149 [Fonsecaea multimorphosa CBS 102226]|uniref:GrpB family protein n=1 Tax=Fonsecaea multimorphosa CBS 102226 TaxID=1442371 RepID=A0A0D2KBN7_9EURO|nr:uncharacterized protein Z520_00149 [Fonsecaea multimorphosa CBS 102226]KIY03458.1 hypothetical protein Z520_00149 [Fonsecaea multimorphosa CBS 102226]OAL32716.1 hypothetical protein AYO22_00190 [Fonsecaea multimorphosa]